MLSRYSSRNRYKGLERRSHSERRIGRDRRNLIRFECYGSDRRAGYPRRGEEMFWHRALDSEL